MLLLPSLTPNPSLCSLPLATACAEYGSLGFGYNCGDVSYKIDSAGERAASTALPRCTMHPRPRLARMRRPAHCSCARHGAPTTCCASQTWRAVVGGQVTQLTLAAA